MLYLEDYLEMIEHLPAELRDRFTEMREQDLSVQNRVDSLEERQKNFFSNCAKNKLKGSEKEDYESIRKEYQKVIEDASEKVQLAEDSYSLVDKYMRKLDQELLKFKLELEADNRGITEILEKHSLEMDQPGLGVGGSSLKENRHPKKHETDVTSFNENNLDIHANESNVDQMLLTTSFVMGGSNSPTTEELLSGGNRSGTGSGGTPEQEWYDPSEPRYCICNQVSYGDMVACDNEDCPYEWFHYPCVGIEAPPKGKWYCPTCTANMARRKGRK